MNHDKPQTFPLISILLAARNEEENIVACLQKIEALDYPKESLEILIGDDQSQDKTSTLVKAFIQDKPHFKLFLITENIGLARGKANVLAHLAQEAQGSLLFITDADIRVSPHWLELRRHFAANPNLGILTAFTLIQGKNLFAKMQALDWAYGFGLIKMTSDWKIPLTAVGNNMVLKKEAYNRVGGYAQIPFSITEDFALYKSIIQKGFDFKQVIEARTMAFSQPLTSLGGLLQQRKRWLVGGMESAFYIRLLMILQLLLMPFLIFLCLVYPSIAWALLAFTLLSQGIFIISVLRRVNQLHLGKYLIFFEIYFIFFMISLIIFYLMPIKIVWKDRVY